MPSHDAYARLTPYELAFPDLATARERFAAIEAEVEERGEAAAADPEALTLLAAAGETLREVRAPDEDPARIRQHGHLLWHGFRMWRAGEPVVLLGVHGARYVLDPGTDDPWDGSLPAPAGYLQLPQHLVWIRDTEGGTPESLDGFFWASAPGGRLFLLLATGLREGRPGLAVVPLDGLPLDDAPSWASLRLRDGGDDFASSLPGAELEGLYELRSGGEAVKLAARALRHVGRVEGRRREPGDPAEAGEGPRPSRLPHRIVNLD